METEALIIKILFGSFTVGFFYILYFLATAKDKYWLKEGLEELENETERDIL